LGGNIIFERRGGGRTFDFGYTVHTYADALPVRFGQRFTLATSSNISKVTVKLTKLCRGACGHTDGLIAKIAPDLGNYVGGNAPSADIIASSTNVISANTLTAFSTAEFDFLFTGVSLTAGQKYWLVFQRTGSLNDNNRYGIEAANGSSPEADLFIADWTGTGAWDIGFGALTAYFIIYD
jgi:hypothetical protein